MKTKYKDLIFEKEASFDFEKWLKETTAYTVDFKDKGQDLLKIWVATNSEVIHCNLQSSVWSGFFVDKSRLEISKLIYLKKPSLERDEPYDLPDFTIFTPYNFIVSKITETIK